jgi:hypothetical protein
MPCYYQNGNGELPAEIKAMLRAFPPSGTGKREVNRHLLKIANRLRHYLPLDDAAELVRAAMPRRPKRGEIEETIGKPTTSPRSLRPGRCHAARN